MSDQFVEEESRSPKSEPKTMAETQDQPKPDLKPNISFSIWPPSQRTRDAVIHRLIETLAAPSVLSKRYGALPEAEAAATAKLIEEEAFAVASGSASADDDGIEILQGYSKEISKRMLETVKSRSGGVDADVKVEEDESVKSN